MALLTTCVSLAALVGGAAASCDTAGRTDASSAVNRSSSEDDYTRQMEQLKTELLQALPAIPPQARARYLESLAQRAKAEAELKAAQARCEQVAKAQGLVDHARGKWIGGADKGIAEAKAKLAQAQTPVEKQTAEQELAKWEQNRLDGEAALQERLAALAEAQREQPQHEQAVKVAEAALADARAQTAQAIEGLGLQAFLASDQLDRKLAKYVVLYEATPRGLAEFAKQSSRNQDLLEKMFADEGLLVQMVLADGAQKGKYGPAMAIFEAIQDASPKAREGVFQRLALAIALEHAEPIARRNAVADTAAPAFVDPVQRYLHYERAFLAGELDPAFDQLTVWDLRMVVYGEEPDELLAWGREMLKNYRPDHIATPDYRWRYVGAVRTDVKYGSQDCKYDQDELQFFQNILMNGGVCGRRAFFGRFILRAFGIPTTARPQKGHAALVHWTPDGWVVCLGANWGNGWTKTVYDKDLDFLATTQARALGADYLRVKRAHWIGDLLGEKRVYGELSGQPEFWNSIALLTQRQLIEAAQVKALAAVGEDIAEANESKEKETFAPVIITEEDRQISVDAAGVLTIPAVATSKPLQSTGKILFMNSVLGGKQLHYNRNGGPEDFEYEVVIPEAGKYLLGARVVTPSWRQSLQVRVNAAADPQDILLPFTVGEWEATQPIVVDLQAGKNVLRFSREGATAGITIKDFTLTPAPGE